MPRKGTPERALFDERLAQPQLIQGAHHLSEVPNAGQDDFLRRAHLRGVARDAIRRAGPGQCVLDRTQVAGAVIDDGDHSRPLVLGNWFFNRASFEQA
jgi:hypothetical protein